MEPSVPLSIFRENFVEKLRGSVRDNLRRYRSKDSWISEIQGSRAGSIQTTLEPACNLHLRLPQGEDLKDLENAIHVHSALSALTPVQARDPRLWTRLAHVECWPYMRARWGIERFGGDAAKTQRFIVNRYFIARNESRALLRNGMARLWWYGYLTHDPNRRNPYELTGVLLSTLDITQQILERSLGRVPQVRAGFLECLLRNKKHLVGSGEDKRVRVRHLAKHLNLVGGVTLLDCLGKSEVLQVLDQEFVRICKNPELLAPAN